MIFNHIRKIVISTVVLATVTAMTVLFLPLHHVVSIEYEDSGNVLVYFTPQKFKILYTHSIHLTPVLETYQINDENNITQTELLYENFSVGMPSNASGTETFVIDENGNYQIQNMNRIFPYIDLKVGKVIANHQLIVGNKTIPFQSFVEPGTWVRINVGKKALWQLMKGVELDERET